MPLLMIPGPIEVSPAVVDAASGPPPGHLAPSLIESFGASLELMRRVWLAPSDAQPFIVAGSGTLAMEMAATNLLDPGESVLVVSSGYFSDRMAEMLRRRGAKVTVLRAEPGDAPSLDAVEEALSSGGYRALFATHVDTSTGVRVDARAL
ncbi:MAG TPA: aminotransferase class V-fold PLP-dependent enzyme, partial [Sandaracinaceae bacterium]